jgi:pimeloyl-ACP methyl ester carboxylesterase
MRLQVIIPMLLLAVSLTPRVAGLARECVKHWHARLGSAGHSRRTVTTCSAISPPTGGKLKVLCLHGYTQNGEVLRDRSGGFRKPLKKSRYELHYVDGPHGCTADGEAEADAEADLSRRAWWKGHSGQEAYDGWPASRAMLTELWRRERFDGVLGFSQGAAAAAMLCAEMTDPKPKFALLVSGFVPRDRAAAAALLAGVDAVPTLHVVGRADALVAPERSRALAALFDGATLVEHEGGHTTPSSPDVRKEVAGFLERVVASLPADGDADAE